MSKRHNQELKFYSEPQELEKSVQRSHRKFKQENKTKMSQKEIRRKKAQERQERKENQPTSPNFKFKILPNESREINGKKLYRILALRDIFDSKGNLIVKAGTKGGWISNFKSLSQFDSCWVHPLGEVMGKARVIGDAQLRNGIITDEVCLRSSVCINSGEILTGKKSIHY